MSRLPLVLLMIAVPAFAQDVDGGASVPVNPDPPGLDEAVTLVQAGDPAALPKLEAMLKDAPENPKLLTLRCVATVMHGEAHAAEAVKACDEAARVSPSDTKVRMLLATSQESAGQDSDALESFRAVTIAPDSDERADAQRAVERLDSVLHAGRHFSFLWDAETPPVGTTQPQVWMTPRWGRVDSYTAIELRAGVLQAITRSAAIGFFIDATPLTTGPTQAASIVDARGTLLWHHGGRAFDGLLGAFDHVEFGLGPFGVQLQAMLGADAQLGPLRVGLNVDVTYDRHFTSDGIPPWHTRQLLGLMYGLNNGFSFGIEMVNRVSWEGGDFRGMAFYFGPSLSYRGKHVWVAISLMPQVSAVKFTGDTSGVPLEVNDNERFWFRVTLGTVAP